MRRRERGSPSGGTIVMGTQYTYYKGNLIGTQPFPYNLDTRGQWSGQDVCLDSTNPGPPYRSGGAFLAFHWADPGHTLTSVGSYSGALGLSSWNYVGGFLPSLRWQNFGAQYSIAALQQEYNAPGSQFPSEANAFQHGAAGWNRYRPGKPTADLGVFVGEIRDVPRMLSDTAKGFSQVWKAMGGSFGKPSKELANHWLSAQFGWLPFVNDLRKFHSTYVKLDKMINHIKRNNGRWCSRGGSVVDDSQEAVISESSTSSMHLPALVQYLYNTPVGSHRASVRKTTKAWFEGRFRYWIPNVESPTWKYRAIAELYGAMPNPALIWELTPFSWLVDWVANVGDVVSNMDTGWADNLAAKYAFIMKTTEVVGELSSFANFKSCPLHDTWTFPITWKARSGASRFGFGLTEQDFTARQWSILGALGIQKYS